MHIHVHIHMLACHKRSSTHRWAPCVLLFCCLFRWMRVSFPPFFLFGSVLCIYTLAQMEASLATFLTPERLFSHQIYRAQKESVFNLARRCFFLLLRYTHTHTHTHTPTHTHTYTRTHTCFLPVSLHRNGCYEKCLELGEQIEARDLVMVSDMDSLL